jgi:hypothetical protein
MNITTNRNILNIDGLESEQYNNQTAAIGRRLKVQADALIVELGIDLPAEIEFEGFAEAGEGVEGMLQAALDVDTSNGATGYDSLSDWEQHGILAVHPDTYYATEIVRPEDVDNGDGTYQYVGNGAIGNGRVTRRPASSADKVAAKLNNRKPETVADMVRKAGELGVVVNNKTLQRFQRKYKGHQRTVDALLAFAAEQAK